MGIDVNAVGDTGAMRDDEVDEAQMMNILNYYDRHKNEPEKYVEIFNQIASQYSKVQLRIILSWLPKNVQEVVKPKLDMEVIKKIAPDKIYKIENINGDLSFINPCYPSYAIRELYCHDRYDYMILCEDMLAKRAIEDSLQKNNLRNSKLICICPVGGWENVLKLHLECVQNNILGLSTNIISILDGDIKEECRKKEQYKNLKKIFLPIASIEKCLFDILYNEKFGLKLKKDINDNLFTCKSVDTINSEFIDDGCTLENKKFYNYIKKDLKQRNIEEGEFIIKLLNILYKEISFEDFDEKLKKELN